MFPAPTGAAQAIPVFHCAGVLLEPGAVIEPGNFGRVIRRYGQQHNLYNRETLLENYRTKHHPQAPSRLSCVYAAPSESNAVTFLSAQPTRWSDLIYRVEILDPTATTFCADLTQVADPTLYWSRVLPSHPNAELLIASPIKILERLTLGPAFSAPGSSAP
ncbi:MAG: DUF2441 domain-containing protein [Actinomycetota bacterium]